jgi:ADP-ribosylglycohydrolase
MITTFWYNVLGMFYGSALGDALGAPFIYTYSESIKKYTGKVELNPALGTYSGLKQGVVGQVTFNTEICLTLAKNIVENKGYFRNRVLEAYKRFPNSDTIGLPESFEHLGRGGKQKYFNMGNNSLVRSVVLSLIPGMGFKNVIDDVNLTNNNRVNRECSIILVKVLREILFDEDFNIFREAKQREIKEAILQAKNKEVRNIKERKSVINALYCAIYCYLHFTDIQEGINWVIRLGGDTSTNAFVSAAVLASMSNKRILVDPILEPNLLAVLEADTKDGNLPIPEGLEPKEWNQVVIDLAELLPEIDLYNTNVNHILDYFNRGMTPMLVNHIPNTTEYRTYIFLRKNILLLKSTEDQSNVFNVESIEVIDKYKSVKKLIEKVSKAPYSIDYLFDGQQADLYKAYRFQYLLIEALKLKVVGELLPDMILEDTNDQLYNKKYFLLND